MTGNATFRHENTALLAVTSVEAPVVVSSAEFDERLAPSLKRLRLSKRLLERVAGVTERRWWSPGSDFDDAAIEAGADEYVMKPFDRETLQSKLNIVGMA